MAKFAICVVALACGLSVLLGLLMYILAMRMELYRNAATPFECGFDPKNSARTPFSLRFFLLAVIFLIFDVEVVLLLPFLFIANQGGIVGAVGGIILVLLILLAGLFHEWREGSLDWV